VNFHERAEAESIGVEGMHQFANPLRTLLEIFSPSAQLSGGQIILAEAFDHRVGC
jgi:hypothetical protein